MTYDFRQAKIFSLETAQQPCARSSAEY